jgi:uncharacterized protein (DUF433 family)
MLRIKEFPDLAAKDVAACLDYARDLAEFEGVPGIDNHL